MEAINYKGFTIQYAGGECYEYWRTSEGYNPDAELVGEDWRNCGNTWTAFSIEEAKDAISLIVIEETPWHVVMWNGMKYEFTWISDAIKFITTFGGELQNPPQAI